MKNLKFVMTIAMSLLLVGCGVSKSDTEAFQQAKSELIDKNGLLEVVIADAKQLYDTHATALDEATYRNLMDAINKANDAIVRPSDIPSKTPKVKDAIEKMNAVNYSDIEDELHTCITDVKNSVMQYNQVTNPSMEFVAQRITGIDHIYDIEPISEETDPYHNMNKDGYYTGMVYFSDDRVALESGQEGASSIVKRTDGGDNMK